MNFLNAYYDEDDTIRVSRQQASDFAKQVAGDFNPIHDPDSKRFCVPGDLLFSLVLNKYGLSQQMNFTFAGIVGDGVELCFPQTDGHLFSITDNTGRDYLHIQRDGDTTQDPDIIRELIRHYVEFSGRTFPHILIPLMAGHQVMLNPERPMVIYESMSINMDRLDFDGSLLELELNNSNLSVDGKRGNASLEFNIKAADVIVGTGAKKLILSGLRTFEQSEIDRLVNDYDLRKQAF